MEQVILVDDQNKQIGLADKATIHTKNTPLHRAFSLFVFNSKKQLLVTQRAVSKKTFPGVWTNTVCGHVSPGETTIEAAKRRAQKELGLKVNDIKEISPYRYRFADKNGIVENEICPILLAHTDADPTPDLTEVEAWKWVDWQEFLKEIKDNPELYSPWSREEAVIVNQKVSVLVVY